MAALNFPANPTLNQIYTANGGQWRWNGTSWTSANGLVYADIIDALGFLPEDSADKGVANGYASLDATAKIPSAQLPSYVDDVVEYATVTAFPATGASGVIYVTSDTGKAYRWSGSAYVEISASPGTSDNLVEGSVNLYFTTARARGAVSATGSISYNPSTGVFSFTDAVTTVAGRTGDVVVTKSDVGLGNVDNKSSATIRGEITSGNVTTALGYTPANKAGDTLTGDLNFDGNKAIQPRLQAYRETVATVTPAGGNAICDLGTANVFDLTLTSATTALQFSNAPASGLAFSITVVVRQDATGNRALTYPASVRFTDGVTPVLATAGGKIDVLTFFTVDGGTTYMGGQALANL